MRAPPPPLPASPRHASPRHDAMRACAAICGIVPRCRAYLSFCCLGKLLRELFLCQPFAELCLGAELTYLFAGKQK
jgi:hypothetical protein